MCEEYLLSFHKKDIICILQDEDASRHFSININFIVLYEHQPNLVVQLLEEPEKCLEEWDNATLRAQMALLREVNTQSQLKNSVHCRIYHLPGLSEVRRTVFPDNNDAGKFLQVSGTVMRIKAAKLLEYQRNYICIKCKYPMLVKAEYDRKYMIKQPRRCENPEGCSSTNIVNLGELDSENCKDFQEIKIQEQITKIGISSVPNTMWVTLEDDLVDSCKPGDNVTICGIVKRRWGEFSASHKIEIDITLKANNVLIDNNNSSAVASTPDVRKIFDMFWEKYSGNPLEARDIILKSFCPQLYGLHLVKLAVAVVLAGGTQIEDTTFSGVRTRSESHLLLVGDPGTGKSQLLRFSSKIIPRSVLTTGVGSTAAGLTVTAFMEHGEWQLEGGALVMSDGGICCIDEFNSMKEHDRTSIHEAMEQQTISVAKASIVCKLNTRCSVLAACNPKGNLDLTQPLCMNVALPSPLLSRFDLILMLRDKVNEEWDSKIADCILGGAKNYSKLTSNELWNTDMLQSYFAVIKKFQPKLTEDAETILNVYYQMQRRIANRNKARTTVRLLESLIRLSQGHARLMYHEQVRTIDSIYAIILIDAAMECDSAILNLNVNTHSDFPEKPVSEYCKMLEIILSKLQLPDILDKELAVLNKNCEHKLQSRFFYNNRKDKNSSDTFKENVLLPENRKTKEAETECKNSKKIRKTDKVDYLKSTENTHESDLIDVQKEKPNTSSVLQDKNKIIVDVEDANIVHKTSTKNKYSKNKVENYPKQISLVESESVLESEQQLSQPKQTESSENSVEMKKASTKNKLKKFKFVPKNDYLNVQNSRNSCSPDSSVRSSVVESNRKIDQTDSDQSKKKKFRHNSDILIENDIKMLKLMPGANDDFNIDLEFDWDNFNNFKATDGSNSSENSAPIKSKDCNSSTSLNSALPKCVREESNMTRTESSSSSQNRKTIFDEDFDDLDLDI